MNNSPGVKKADLNKKIDRTFRSQYFSLIMLLLFINISAPVNGAQKPDTKPPKIKILSPKAEFTATGPLRIITSASDKRGIMKVAFFLDGELVQEVYNPPYTIILNVGFWADGMIHRIKAVATDNSGNSTDSEDIQITILKSAFTSPYLLYPRNKMVIKNRSQIFLKWKSLYGANNYVIAIAKDRDFKNVVASYTVTDTSLITEPLTIGRYYWAVVAKNPAEKWSEWSVFHEFSIEPPLPPELIGPKHKFYYKSTETPRLSWHKSKYASAYEVKVVKALNPEFIQYTKLVRDTFAVLSGLEEEWHQWSVRPRNKGGIYGEWSETREFYTSSPEVTQFVKVAAGEYTSGRDNIIQKINYDYEIMKYPVTCRQYLNFLNQAYCRNAVDMNGYGHYEGDEFKPAGEYKYIDVKEKKKEIGDILFDTQKEYFILESNEYMDHPIGDVSWFGAHAYAKWYDLALATEEEWEKAARGRSGFNFPWGNDIDCQNANIASCMERGFSASTTPVGKYNGENNTMDSPSPYGAYDMSGNVWEWTNSWFGGNFRSYRVIKGGSYHESKGVKANLESLSTWYRYWMDPQSTSGKYGSAVGFRCILHKE
ncbi:MAG: SUMF1/EgtB/PvdO family nonheme iron enzyme [Candidatus Marinimicrobia bacterium]|nr:SUMF1/EgtB/PvdO family nonheme iron enzyme [Candidatus Neomarinimicrobiota bacterium]